MARAAGGWLRGQAALSRRATSGLVGLGLFSALIGVGQAFCLAHLVGPALLGRDVVDVPLWAGLFGFAALLRAALGLLADAHAVAAGAAGRRRLRTGFLIEALEQGPYGAVLAGRAGSVGSALATAIDRIEALDNYFSRWLPTSVLAWAAPLLVMAAVLLADPLAGLAMAVGGGLVPFGMALAGIGAARASQQQFAAMARLQARFLDRVRGIATIVMAGQQEAEARRLQAAALELAGRTMRVLRVAFLSSAILDVAAVGVLVTLAIRAGLAWRAGVLHPVAVVFTLILVSEFFAPLRAFAAAYQDRIQANAAAATLGAVMPGDAGPSPALVPPAIRTVAASGVTVAFEGVGFTWDAGRGPALANVTFRVPANETAVLVGPSGSGKSTLIELLLGFIKPETGRITINGADLATLTPAALSRITAWIGQRPTLFAGSIIDNIRFGQQDATDSAIEAAVIAAGLDEVARSLPDGLQTVIGEGGYGLSGGQAQRVAIARAFVRNAPLLLLDEPTAHLDPAIEADVLDRMRRLAIGRTVIMAAHSSAAMALGGRRIVLEHGHLVDVQGVA